MARYLSGSNHNGHHPTDGRPGALTRRDCAVRAIADKSRRMPPARTPSDSTKPGLHRVRLGSARSACRVVLCGLWSELLVCGVPSRS
jgi:hypothetical protein